MIIKLKKRFLAFFTINYENFCIKNGFGYKTAQKSHFD
ncbi:hypothetical protein OUM_0454 [Helicobacter pylori R038b]|uniref:Uncharacterized protein n=1 Tax=Helicobacter pylori R038b TaxID=1145115 RepID=K2KX03_HELPX|nr:hypothetical protein OUM_0454 [Helicobacter pylori R038b]